MPCRDRPAVRCRHRPAIGAFVEFRAIDPGVELDVAADIETIGDVAGVLAWVLDLPMESDTSSDETRRTTRDDSGKRGEIE